MFDISKVSDNIKSAVAQIAAFDGNTRKVDSKAEMNTLAKILAGCDNEEDREYVQGFMIEHSKAKTPKIDGKNPERNEERSVVLKGVHGPISGATQEEIDRYINNNWEQKAFYNENGDVQKIITRNKEGEITSIANFQADGDIVTGKYENRTDNGTFYSELRWDNISHKLLSSKLLDANGNVLQAEEMLPNNSKMATLYYLEGGKSVVSISNGQGYRTEFDTDGNFVKAVPVSQDENGVIQEDADESHHIKPNTNFN